MTREAIADKIRAIIAEHLSLPPDREIKDDDEVIADLDGDSLDIIELRMACEEEFGIEISDEVGEKIVVVRDMVDAVCKLTGAK